MKSTRDRILQSLLFQPRATINDLAVAVGINSISVRHHLTSLQADGLINAEEERHGVGRPRLIYNLTEKGQERFPSRYFRLANMLLSQMKDSLPALAVKQMFTRIAEGIAADYIDKTKSLSTEQKLDLVKDVLGQEGFVVEWEKSGNQYMVHEITCPYYHVGQNHPEVCAVDQTLISSLLSIPAEKVSCVLSGDAHCTYIISNTGKNGA